MKALQYARLVCLLSVAVGVSADEVWSSADGDIVYRDEVGPVAVWTYRRDGQDGEIYLPGLAGVYERRGTVYEGYWAQASGAVACASKRPGPGGETTAYWGRFHLYFERPDFPSGWTAKWGACEQALDKEWKAQPVTG